MTLFGAVESTAWLSERLVFRVHVDYLWVGDSLNFHPAFLRAAFTDELIVRMVPRLFFSAAASVVWVAFGQLRTCTFRFCFCMRGSTCIGVTFCARVV